MKKLIISALVLLNLGFSQGEEALPFLLIAPNAVSSGIGESGVSFPETPGLAMHYNVAGLAYIDKYGDIFSNQSKTPISLGYAKWLPEFDDDLWYMYAASLMKVEDLGVFGASIRYMNLGQVITTNSNGDETPENHYTAREYEVSLAYSTELSNDVFVGAAAKYIYSGITTDGLTVGNNNTEKSSPAQTVAVDIGFFTRYDKLIGLKNVKIGASWVNIGPNISYVDNDQSDPLPIYLRGGISGNIIEDESSILRIVYETGLLTIDQSFSSDESFGQKFEHFVHSGGVEFIYEKIIAMRAGFFAEPERVGDRKFLTAGIGFNANFVVVDSSYLISLNDKFHPLDGTIRFSLRFNI
jgi:hypothetical protein